jgi:hypothetical protein
LEDAEKHGMTTPTSQIPTPNEKRLTGMAKGLEVGSWRLGVDFAFFSNLLAGWRRTGRRRFLVHGTSDNLITVNDASTPRISAGIERGRAGRTCGAVVSAAARFRSIDTGLHCDG